MTNGRWEAMSTPLLAVMLFAGVILLLFVVAWNQPEQSPREQSERRLFQGQVEEIQRGKSTVLWFYETQGVDAYLEQAASLPALETLDLDRTDVTDAGLQQLGRLPRLHKLAIRGGRITAQGVECLATCTSLQELELRGIPITKEGIDKLSRLPKLQTFVVDDKRIK
jgi:hypothetical protein